MTDFQERLQDLIIENNLNIPLREMSFGNHELDVEKMIEIPELVLVRNK